MRKLNKIVSVAAALALAGATLSMSACAEDAEKLEIMSVTEEKKKTAKGFVHINEELPVYLL